MRKHRLSAVLLAVSMSLAVTACGNNSETKVVAQTEIAQETTVAQTTSAATENTAEVATSAAEDNTTTSEKTNVSWETIAPEEVDSAIYEMTGGGWFYKGDGNEKSMDMDGLKGLTTYTSEAKPEYEGYLQYLGQNQDGLHVFDVYDLYGRQFMTLTFVSEDQFYVDDDENEYYVKWDY